MELRARAVSLGRHPCQVLLVATIALARGEARALDAEPTFSPGRGLVVQEVAPGSVAERAEIRRRDVLLAWSRLANPPASPEPAKGAFVSPLDLYEIEIDQAPRGAVVLEGLREGRARTWTLKPGRWGLTATPQLGGEIGRLTDAASRLLAAQNPAEPAQAFADAARRAEGQVPASVLAWLKLAAFGSALADGGGDIAQASAALALLESDDRKGLAAKLAIDLAIQLEAAGRVADAEVLARPVVKALQARPESLLIASVLHQFSTASARSGNLEAARNLARGALQLREKLAPGSLAVAQSLVQVGSLVPEGDRSQVAEEFYHRALTIQEDLAPDGLDTAKALDGLVRTTLERKDCATASTLARRALQIRGRLEPESQAAAANLSALGICAALSGAWLEAEDLFQRSLAIREKQNPAGADVAWVLDRLADLAGRRNDAPARKKLLERRLAILEKTVPDTLEMAGALGQLGYLAQHSSDPDGAEARYRQALAIQQRLAPASAETAVSLGNLGELALRRGDIVSAHEQFRRSLTVLEHIGEESPALAWILDSLGRIALQEEDFEPAEKLLLRSLAIRERLEPESAQTAEVLGTLGVIVARRDDLASAETLLRRALAIWEVLAPDGRETSDTLLVLAGITEEQRDDTVTETLLRRALALQERLAPESEATAMALGSLAGIAERRDDLEAAVELYQRELLIRQRLKPEGELVAWSLTHLGELASRRGDLSGAEGFHRRALAIRERIPHGELDVASSLGDIGDLLEKGGSPEKAEELFQRALHLGEGVAPDGPLVARALSSLASLADDRNDAQGAEQLYRRALAVNEKSAPESLQVAGTLNSLGMLAEGRGDLAAAEELYQRSLRLRERLAPESSEVAWSLSNLADVARTRGDRPAAEPLYRRSLEIRQKLSLDSLDVAASLSKLGDCARETGRLAAARDLYTRALAIQSRLAPDSEGTVESWVGLGIISLAEGDLVAAQEHLTRGLAIAEKSQRNARALMACLLGLGLLENVRENLIGAEAYYQRALSLQEAKNADPAGVAATHTVLGLLAASRADWQSTELHVGEALAIYQRGGDRGQAANMQVLLGMVSSEKGDLDKAKSLLQVALATLEEIASPDAAGALAGLAGVAAKRGESGEASTFFTRALRIWEAAGPDGVQVAWGLVKLADVKREEHRTSDAVALYERGLRIFEARTPGLGMDADALRGMGLAQKQLGLTAEAATYLCRAVESLELVRSKVGGSEEARAAVAVALNYEQYYRDCADALLELGREGEAVHVIERSRARTLLTMLAERELLFAADLPEDLARERQVTELAYRRAQAELGGLKGSRDPAKETELAARLRELRDRRAGLVAQIRKAAPRFAALQYPEPLDLAGVRGSLDAGTLLLSYSVGKERTVVFAVQASGVGPPEAPGLSVFTMPLGEDGLREKVIALRRALSGAVGVGRGVIPLEAGADPEGEPLARELYDLLVGPAEGLVESAERILISPDGPLHTLPFAALRRDDGRYLVEWKPLHVVVSATVYAELKKTRRETSLQSMRVAAFGDPRYPRVSKELADKLASPEVRSVVRGGATLSPLPNTRGEVHAIAGLFPASSQIYLGEEATEGRAKAVGKQAEVLHFACHGLVDERFPLNSALALTIPESPKEGEDNGLLQAWEIFESVRIDANLVTLSACETALGQELGGEGLVGLTRAFQYAGARSVLASLWSVGDTSTAQLMKAFYAALRAGKSKDEALRQAQIGLLKSPKTAHPFHWAAFEVIGDWK